MSARKPFDPKPVRLRFRIRGAARRFYAAEDTMELDGMEVTTSHPDVKIGYRPSADSPPVPCRLMDGSPCYVKPINLVSL
jgi:hypothetical protein